MTRANSFRRHPGWILAWILAASLPSTEAWGQQWQSARLVALSGARRALAAGSDALVLNPAGMALNKRYMLEAGYGDDLRESDRRVHVSITDGYTGSLAGGLAYTYGSSRPLAATDPEDRLEGHRIDGGLASQIADGVAFGVTLRGLIFDFDSTTSDLGDLDNFTVDVGFQWRISPAVSWGVSGQNLTNIPRADASLKAGSGVGVMVGSVSVESDVVYDAFTERFTSQAGAEAMFFKMVPARLGVLYDTELEQFGLSGGLGIQIDRLSLDAAYSQRINNLGDGPDADQRIFVVSLAVRLF